MHVTLELDLCVGHAQCQDAAPEVFRVNDDGVAEILDESPAESLRAKVEEAVWRCPTSAIHLEG